MKHMISVHYLIYEKLQYLMILFSLSRQMGVIQIYFKMRGVHCSLPMKESMLDMIEESVKTSGSSMCR